MSTMGTASEGGKEQSLLLSVSIQTDWGEGATVCRENGEAAVEGQVIPEPCEDVPTG